MSFRPADHVIPAEACAVGWNLWAAGCRNGIYGRRFKKQRPIKDGFRKHRSHATAQGLRWDDMLSEACFNG